nr:hypothetical protein [Tanacetum cinerariifolium]
MYIKGILCKVMNEEVPMADSLRCVCKRVNGGLRSYAIRSQTEASQSRQSMDCHKFDSWKNLTSHLPIACLMLALAGFPSSLENAHLKATYKNLFDSISVSRAQTKTIIASLQNELQSNIYKNAKLAKQPIVETLPKIGETNALSKPVTLNSVSISQESKGLNNDKVIAPEMFRINPSKTSREEKHVPNTVSASNRTKPITYSQPPFISKKDVNSDLNGLSSTGIDNTKTKRPQPRSNIKHDRVPSASKSSRSNNKEAEVKEYHRNFVSLWITCNNRRSSDLANFLEKERV